MNKDQFIEALNKTKTSYLKKEDDPETKAFIRKFPTLYTIIVVQNTLRVGEEFCHSYWFFSRLGELLGVAHYGS